MILADDARFVRRARSGAGMFCVDNDGNVFQFDRAGENVAIFPPHKAAALTVWIYDGKPQMHGGAAEVERKKLWTQLKTAVVFCDWDKNEALDRLNELGVIEFYKGHNQKHCYRPTERAIFLGLAKSKGPMTPEFVWDCHALARALNND